MKSFSLAKIFSDGMVLQRNKKVKVWGTGLEGIELVIEINGNKKITTIRNGSWSIYLDPMKEKRNTELSVYRKYNREEKITINNVAIGEVWIAGGQSNMEFLLKYETNYEKEMKSLELLDVRFFDVPKTTYNNQINDFKDAFRNVNFWREMTKNDIGYYSAVGYYFGKDLCRNLNITIGIIGCNYGGTSASVWLDEMYLENDTNLNVYIKEYKEATKNLDINKYEESFMKERNLYYSDKFQHHNDQLLKKTLSKKELEEGAKQIDFSTLMIPTGPKSSSTPGILYKNMLLKIAGYGIKGVIWYQGESDEKKANIYEKLFTSLIKCWREAWNEEIPFLFVQLTSFKEWLGESGDNYPLIREQQENVSLGVKNSYMISTMDCGMEYDIHPKEKKRIGERLSLLARGKIYGENIVCESPDLLNVSKIKNKLILDFSNVTTFNVYGNKINGFNVKVDDKNISGVNISTTNNKIILEDETFDFGEEIEVNFANQGYVDVNIFSETKLPLKPFNVKYSNKLNNWRRDVKRIF